MSEENLESALAQVADDLSSATDAIREKVAHSGKLLTPDSSPLDGTASPASSDSDPS